ncbi:3-oxoacyl-[acyl-carrier-protein] synthase III C-terminal domain-containing protein [Bradyrhizobium sp. 21]|uniref:3-oxoacyl-[acyl-carrier-protein] synthase III C-terminal domain-containing protein n=1 Tax=Bradyrhizobium sp. 21 TaxID=2782666 RepID=UPI001FFACAC1|nr:3-oxoacyl-[acyl-carrier-protein] synthase III C-terminal domain-containing protein [Bradyrhizobium sp. 21]MCK1387649.1 hypothetical protein [Bradyrhizobium sp. 21]
MSPSYLTGLAYKVGEIRSLDELPDLADQERSAWKARGFRSICINTRSLREICVSAAEGTLRRCAIRPSQVGAIVMANSSASSTLAQDTDLVAGLSSLGFGPARIFGLGMQACSVASGALQLASCLLADETIKNVLVIVFGQANDVRERFGQATLFSDGAVACVVSSDRGPFEVVVNATTTDVALAAASAANPNSVARSYRNVCSTLKSVLERSGVSAGEIREVFAGNTNQGSLQLIAEAAGVTLPVVYRDGLPRFGHVFACDGLIGLHDYVDANEAEEGDCFLLVGWSSHVVGATVLRWVAAGTSDR